MQQKNVTNKTQNASGKMFFKKSQNCPLEKVSESEINYKNLDLLKKFISTGGRILPRRITNVSSKKQRRLKEQIKVARILALLPFVN